ncbi:MAG: winged helix-turn-helix transcriptional regulator [Chloroflexi bacterium]|nr:winged helix-turn-helix transcriptional regulator [Chloroflexota bacterium]
MSEVARRTELLAQIAELEPQMLRVLGPAQAREWVDVDLTMSQLKMMFVLSRSVSPVSDPGLRVSEVARGLGVTLPTVTAVMDKLVERGLVRRDDDPTDRRQHVCRLTSDGNALLQRLMAGRRAFTNMLMEHLDDDELATFLNGMQVLLRAGERLHASAGCAGGPSVACPAADAPAEAPFVTVGREWAS